MDIDHKCFLCNKEIKKNCGFPHDKEWEGSYNDGIVERISAGYGSDLDGDMFVIAICDDCVIQKYKEGKIMYVGNYFAPELGKEFVMPDKYK